jgi:hypothetical protein
LLAGLSLATRTKAQKAVRQKTGMATAAVVPG